MWKALKVWIAKHELDSSHRAMMHDPNLSTVSRYSKACNAYYVAKYGPMGKVS